MSVSVLFPWRADNGWRDKLANWVLKRWGKLFPDYQVVLGKCDGGPFNRSQAINDAKTRATGDILIVGDLDIIVQKDFVLAAVNRVEKDPNAWGFGFETYVNLTKGYTGSVLLRPVDCEFDFDEVDAERSSDTTMSGLVVISRDGFEKVGGFEEGFVGWGYEDLAFTCVADRVLSPHFRIKDGYVLHMQHERVEDYELAIRNQELYEAKFLGLLKPQPALLPDGNLGAPYEQQMTVANRVPPCTWTAEGLPIGLEINDEDGMISGVPSREEVTTSTVSVTDAEGVTTSRAYPEFTILPPRYKPGSKVVGVYAAWDEPFEKLMERLRWTTPALQEDGHVYKSLKFVDPHLPGEEPHRYGLVFNAFGGTVNCRPRMTYVLIMEPPEIIGEDNAWYTTDHPNAAANIYMFGDGSIWPKVIGLHLPQAMLSEPELVPSKKLFRASMICSDSDTTPYHKKRREVLAGLQATDVEMHFYGRGMQKTNDRRIEGPILTRTKNHALRPYSFTVDFENTDRDVLTDKFLDPILSGTVPITNSKGAAKVFPAGSFEYIDFDLPVDTIVARIREIIEQPTITQYDRPVARAKRLVSVGEVNICEWLYRKIEAL